MEIKQRLLNEKVTMVYETALTQFEIAIRDVVLRNVPGHIIETGVWKGGACILARVLLNELKQDNRLVYVADSFQGLPKPTLKEDEGDDHWTDDELKVSLMEVINNFDRFGVKERSVFVEGWFKDTLPKINAEFSIIRLDGDMFESTWDALINLYPKLSDGGYCIIDDYQLHPHCAQAVDKYRMENKINSRMFMVPDSETIYWIK